MSDDKYAHVRNLPLLGVLAALGHSDWRIRKDGQEHYGACPIHGSKKNKTSFSFHQDGRFACFSCSAKGKGAIDLVMQVEKVNFRTAVERLEAIQPSIPAETASLPSEDETPLISENPTFAGQYEKYAVQSAWLENRGFTPETLKRFTVFQYENPKRRSAYTGDVLLKIHRFTNGDCLGYLARNIGEVTAERPKYRMPKGFRKALELFGAWQIKNDVKQLPLRVAYVVESPFCVMKFAQLGLPAVSPFGFSVSPEQATLLSLLAKGVCFLPDRNKFGEVAQSVSLIARYCWVKTPALPDGVNDPERMTREQILALT